MAKTKIEWCDYSVNPVKGLCPMACSYCYARRMYKRFHWNPEIIFDEDGFKNDWGVENIKKPARIFVGSTMELFGDWVKTEWLQDILWMCKGNPQHTFIFLTKQPQNLIKWSPFPDNCWVGVSAESDVLASAACARLSLIQAKVKFVSLEPFLHFHNTNLLFQRLGWQESYHDINWLIIGQQTPVSPKTAPKIEWIKEIVDAADKADISVFLKNNLVPLMLTPSTDPEYNRYFKNNTFRQEFPRVK